MIDIQVDTADGEPPPLPQNRIRAILSASLADAEVEGASLHVIFVGDEYLRSLKKTYFDQDVFTDVIAFTLNEVGDPLEGEIYISVDRALENSQTYRVPFTDELSRLVAHGGLHLLGYEDSTKEEKAQMRLKEDEVLQLSEQRSEV